MCWHKVNRRKLSNKLWHYKSLNNSIVVGGLDSEWGRYKIRNIQKDWSHIQAASFFAMTLCWIKLPPGVIVAEFSPRRLGLVQRWAMIPMEIEFHLLFEKSPFKLKKHTLVLAIRDMEGNGYVLSLLSRNEILRCIFYHNMGRMEEGNRIFTNVKLENGDVKEVALLVKF
jgi:hypothetical protein